MAGSGGTEFIQIAAPEDGVARITLNRPDKKNALSIALRDEVTAALAAFAEDLAVKVVLLTGAGDSFSAGFDLGEFPKAQDPAFHKQLWESSDRYHLALLRFPLPILAAVNGPALGGGFDTAVLCDIRIASERAAFGHPEARFSDVVYGPLHDLVGGAVARDLCLTGRRIDAREAQALQLVSSVVPADRLPEAAMAMARKIAEGPRPVLQRTKAKIIARAAIEFRATLAL